jgi:4-alpha-glucanotransferase
VVSYLHPTSLPGRHGIGDLGPEAYRFVDFLADTKQQLWQVLPLGPTGHGNSPYLSLFIDGGEPDAD